MVELSSDLWVCVVQFLVQELVKVEDEAGVREENEEIKKKCGLCQSKFSFVINLLTPPHSPGQPFQVWPTQEVCYLRDGRKVAQ